MLKFLVTGGAGFIGSNLVEALLNQNYEVTVLDNLSTGKISNIQSFLNDIRFIKGDIQNLETCYQAVKGMDYVLHQAAIGSVPLSIKDPIQTHLTNVTGTLNMLVAAKDQGIRKVVLAASCAAYGNSKQLPLVESMPSSPLSPYAASKLVTESYASVFSSVYGLPTISLRYFNVFGPKQDPLSQYAAVIPRFISKLISNETIEIYGDGEQTRDFTYIDNVIQANLNACFADPISSGKVYNIACGEQISLNQLFEKLCGSMDIHSQPKYKAAQIGDVRHSLADISLAQAYLNYQPCTNFEQGLKKVVKWYLEQSGTSTSGYQAHIQI
ncbi:SDR family oxidoreductase [Paenibacillus albiflavus]|uniref:SDR family oxidoreductase n=1 Tax=Paenibacillus albiflavus TaxID=2545760 RepID=A0A4R4EC57_9BACL|nr:SDR family oxidoreductase [Paenibacillus albiflavus]TCZ77526.1 SDR family oxidoreductase [Paenibacillus albiflavus]